MKNKVWLFQLPVVALFSFAFWVTDAGINGRLDPGFLHDWVFPKLRMGNGWLTNAKFELRGPQPPKNKIVIVEVDDDSIALLGRWPWHRDLTAELIKRTFDAGAKVVGLDITFSEPDQRVSDSMQKFLEQNKLGAYAPFFESDPALEKVIAEKRDQLVLGWITEGACQPRFVKAENCRLEDTETPKRFPADFEKFSYGDFQTAPSFNWLNSQLFSSPPDLLANLPTYNQAATHAGFLSVWPDTDGYVRRTNLLVMANGKPYPSLPLEMARVGLGEKLSISLNDKGLVDHLKFANSGRSIPVSPLGAMEINFRGPRASFQYIRANQLLGTEGDTIQVARLDRSRSPAALEVAEMSKKDLLKDAYAFIGISAVGVYDRRQFPFDSDSPGVEGHANILDNLLAGDMMVHQASSSDSIWIICLMTLGGLLLAFAIEKLESIPAILLIIAVFAGIGLIDTQILFKKGVDWNTSLLYVEYIAIFMFTLAVKYVMEERNKKFIRGAFSKYVAPAIVDSILKDPTKLTVGGEKRELTIMFSDIRGFTTFSERMDARALAQFLNDYLSIMTDIVFDNEGTLDKYIGDAVMAFWGAPLDQAKHAVNACRAAVKMQQALTANHARFLKQYGVDVQIGVGVNSGAVNVGNMGSSRIFEYTVIGDHVNLASRLEGLTKHYGVKIVTTRFTFDLIQSSGEPLPPHRILDFVKVKGKKNAVELIQVLEKEYPPEALKLFDAARNDYKNRDFDRAIDKFHEANSLLKPNPDENDAPCEIYIERCKELKEKAPHADWDGSWEMHSK